MNPKKLGLGAAALAATAAFAIGGVAITNASAATTATNPSYTSTGTAPGQTQQGQQGNNGPQGNHTAVTGDEATKVSAAVTAKDSAVTVTSVQKDADGSYDVLGTKAGANVMFDVSADLATVTENAGHGGGPGGGASSDTPVTGDEATKASAAVTAKDSTVTVTSVRKDPDGSYDVLGTKAGANVMFDVSADLATVSQAQGGPGGQGHDGKGGPQGGQQGAPSGSSTATPTQGS